MPMAEPLRVLILGGTAEAAALAAWAAAQPAIAVTSSLAGRTRAPSRLAGTVRVGGFQGAEGLAAYLREQRTDLLVDATHPFATTISANAEAACAATRVPRLTLCRPPWPREPGDRWIEVPDAAAAALRVAEAGARVFLSLGRQELAPFATIDSAWFLVRLIEPPETPVAPAHHRLILGRGPFTLEGERALLAAHRITGLVSKNSGGSATYAKIAAAREAHLPVIMIARPPAPAGESVADVDGAVAAIAERLGAAASDGHAAGRKAGYR